MLCFSLAQLHGTPEECSRFKKTACARQVQKHQELAVRTIASAATGASGSQARGFSRIATGRSTAGRQEEQDLLSEMSAIQMQDSCAYLLATLKSAAPEVISHRGGDCHEEQFRAEFSYFFTLLALKTWVQLYCFTALLLIACSLECCAESGHNAGTDAGFPCMVSRVLVRLPGENKSGGSCCISMQAVENDKETQRV